jgi:hypothetical protein
MLERLGCELADATTGFDMVTVNGAARLPVLTIPSIRALGLQQERFEVVAHTLPIPGLHGLLGLDFLSQRRLTIDFRAGTIDLG